MSGLGVCVCVVVLRARNEESRILALSAMNHSLCQLKVDPDRLFTINLLVRAMQILGLMPRDKNQCYAACILYLIAWETFLASTQLLINRQIFLVLRCTRNKLGDVPFFLFRKITNKSTITINL